MLERFLWIQLIVLLDQSHLIIFSFFVLLINLSYFKDLLNEHMILSVINLSLVQSLSRVQLCDPTDCSMPVFPVHHQLPEFTQTYVHWVGEAIQPSHSLSSPSHLVFNLFHHHGLFQWVSSSWQVAKVLELQPVFPQSIFPRVDGFLVNSKSQKQGWIFGA